RGRIVDLDQTPIRVLQFRKIPSRESSRRHRGELVGGPRAELEIVQVKKEKRPVLENGAANAAPVLILAVDRSRPLIKITRIEDVIAEKLVQAPVKIIGSRPDGKSFYASAGISEFSRIATGCDRELLEGIRGKCENTGVAAYFGDRHAETVELNFLRQSLAAIDVGIEGAAGCSRGEKDERFRGPASGGVQGQVDEGLGIH